MMEQLREINSVVISQKKEWGEILTNFEMRNKYSIHAPLPMGREIYFAAEEARNALMRFFLRERRPWTIHIVDNQGQKVLTLKKYFRWFFDELDIFNPNNELIGKLKWEFHVFKKLYAVMDSSGRQIYEISGPLWRPWTFKIIQGIDEVGTIAKQWSGMAKELFTKADNFSLIFPNNATLEHKEILLGAVFLIDFNYFERSNN